MILLLFSFLLILPVLMGYGMTAERCLGALWKGASSSLVLGIIVLILIWNILIFWVPMNAFVEGASLILGYFFFFYHRSYRLFEHFTKSEWYLLVGVGVLMLFLGSGFPFIIDHFGYYIPSIKWLTEYGLVKGLVNLNWILGQMSPWHIFQAGFSHFSDIYLRINVLLVWIFFIYIVEKKSWVMLLFIPIFFFFIQSPSPDLPCFIFSLMILWEILERNQRFDLLFAFSVLVFTIKPTVFWLSILTFLYPLMIFRKGLNFIWLGVFVGFLYVMKNLWVFGYPFFPLSVLDVGIGWKPYEAFFVKSNEVAIMKTFDNQYSLEEMKGFSGLGYVKNWLSLTGVKAWLNRGLLVVLLAFGGYSIFRRDKLTNLIFVGVLVKSIFIIWFSAQYRFFMEVFFVGIVVMTREYWDKKKGLVFFSGLGLLASSALLSPAVIHQYVPSFNTGNYMKNFRWEQLYRPAYYVFNQYQTYKVGNLEFNVPKNYPMDFDVKLPVLTLGLLEEYEKIGVFPQLSAESLGKGLVWKNLNQEERRQLQEIIIKIKNER